VALVVAVVVQVAVQVVQVDLEVYAVLDKMVALVQMVMLQLHGIMLYKFSIHSIMIPIYDY
jgi:hypothetical protein